MPAPHVPVSFLLAGGAAVFSEECVKAMIACSINPEWVGSYDALVAKKQAAMPVAAAQAPAVPGTGGAASGRKLTPEQFVSESTVGHLERDAAFHTPGGRGNHCATVVDGYTEGGAAAMMTHGASGQANTVEDDISKKESEISRDRKAAAAGTATPDAYPPNHRQEDEKKVVSTAVDSHEKHHTGQPLGDTTRKAVPAAKPGEPMVPVIDTKKGGTPSDKAKECLDNYKNALQTKDARVAAIDKAIKDQQAKAADPAEMAKHAAAVTAAQTTLTNAQGAAATAQATRDRTSGELDGLLDTTAPPGAANKALGDRITKVDARLQVENDALAARNNDVATAQRVLTDAQERDPNQQIACLQAERAALTSGSPRTMGVIPPEN